MCIVILIQVFSLKFSKVIRHPIIAVFIKIYVIFFVSLSAFFVAYHSFLIISKWNTIAMRHRFFYSFTMFFVIVLSALFWNLYYENYQTAGCIVMNLFFILNYYVISLQVLWRLTKGELKNVTEDVNEIKDEIRDGGIKNIDYSSQNITKLEDLPKIEEEYDHTQNILLVNKNLAETEENDKKQEQNLSMSGIDLKEDGKFTDDA